MKNTLKLTTLLLLLIVNIAIAQDIKFPESFRSDASLFEGMKFAEIPASAQTQYGVTTNPGLITEIAKTKGFLMSGKIRNVQAVYFEIFSDADEKRASCGFEVAKFTSDAEVENILPKTTNKSKSVILLTIKNYLIIAYGPTSNDNLGNQIDAIAKYFQNKLGAKIFRDRLKEVETSVADGYVSNMPPPLPPAPKNATQIAIEDLDKRIANDDGLAYMRNKKRAKLAPGNYVATSTYPNFETLSFTIDQDSLLHGDYNYHYAEDYSKSPSKESKLTYDHGVLISEIVYKDGKLLGSTTYAASVVKESNDYLITLKSTTKSSNSVDKEVLTVFRNQKPISKITTRLGVSVIKKDFEKKVLEYYNGKGQLIKLKKRGLIEEYNTTGKVIYKDEWIEDNHFVYKNGKLVTKEIAVTGKQQYLVTEYDENGKVLKEFSRGVEDGIAIANPDEYEKDLTDALFAYYKKKAK